LALVVFLALLGVFSSGPLSGTAASSAGGTLTVTYERFVRRDARFEMAIGVTSVEAPEVRLTINRDWVEAFTIEALYPLPVASSLDDQGLHLTFTASSSSLTAVFAIRPNRIGRVAARIIVSGETVPFGQFIYP
jgi:hypothetical protein